MEHLWWKIENPNHLIIYFSLKNFYYIKSWKNIFFLNPFQSCTSALSNNLKPGMGRWYDFNLELIRKVMNWYYQNMVELDEYLDKILPSSPTMFTSHGQQRVTIMHRPLPLLMLLNLSLPQGNDCQTIKGMLSARKLLCWSER